MFINKGRTTINQGAHTSLVKILISSISLLVKNIKEEIQLS